MSKTINSLSLLQKKNNHQKLIFFLIFVITCGVLFRLNNLTLKPYWIDETYTLVRASGYTIEEAREALYTGKIIEINDILKYQRISEERNFVGTIKGLAQEEPQHPPFYFLLTQLWEHIWGTSKLAIRILPALCSLLVFPAVYWLCWELGTNHLTAWITVAFCSVSPIYLRYAQEVRQYSLWLSLMVFASAVFLRSIKKPNKINWTIYCLLLSFSLYCQPISLLLIIAHGIYLFAIKKLCLRKNIIAYFLASGIALILFSPWLITTLSGIKTVQEATSWMTISLPLTKLLKYWSISICRGFLALHINNNNYNIVLLFATPIILALLIYAYYFLYIHNKQIWIFITSIIGMTFLPFLLYDVLDGGKRTTSERFFLFGYLIIYFVISYLFGWKINQEKKPLKKIIWQTLIITILISNLIFCGFSSMASTWWGWSEHDFVASKIIEKTLNPIIITDKDLFEVFPFAHQLKPTTKIILLSDVNSLKIPSGFSDIFCYNPSKLLLSVITDNNIEAKEIYKFQDKLTDFKFLLYKIKCLFTP